MARLEKKIKVKREHGLHARPATLFVQLANKFNSSVQIEAKKNKVDGKSIIAILSLGVSKGVEVKLKIEGDDAKEALAELIDFLQEEK